MGNTKIFVHEKTVPVAWGDMDALGHVNHARYFEYFQEARIEWLADLGLDLKQNTGPVIIHAACTFLRPILYPAAPILKSYLHHLGRTSITLDHEIHQDNQLMVHGHCKIVWIDYLKNKAIPLPKQLTHLFSTLT
jgi:acyl-CoA thioester hydrolase